MRALIVSPRLVIGVAVAAAAVVTVTAAFAASSAQNAPNDSKATATFVQAYRAQAMEDRVASAQGERALRRFLAVTGNACRGSLAHAPRGASFADVEEAITDMLQLKLLRSSVSSVGQLTRAISGLRWTDATLTRRVVAFAASLKKLIGALPPEPPLCGALHAWARGGYATVPAVLVHFSEGFRTAAASGGGPDGGEETTILRLLRSYESADERVIVRDAVAKIAATARDTVTHLYRAKLELYRVLGTKPLVY
jgi:hypothetical protein